MKNSIQIEVWDTKSSQNLSQNLFCERFYDNSCLLKNLKTQELKNSKT